jgi:hypothetical protein
MDTVQIIKEINGLLGLLKSKSYDEIESELGEEYFALKYCVIEAVEYGKYKAFEFEVYKIMVTKKYGEGVV